jgi:hypothetical protein
MMDDFKAVMMGDLKRIVIPEGNLLDVNLREFEHFFSDHPMYTNFGKLLNLTYTLENDPAMPS